jgi:hypothetical protein
LIVFSAFVASIAVNEVVNTSGIDIAGISGAIIAVVTIDVLRSADNFLGSIIGAGELLTIG